MQKRKTFRLSEQAQRAIEEYMRSSPAATENSAVNSMLLELYLQRAEIARLTHELKMYNLLKRKVFAYTEALSGLQHPEMEHYEIKK